MNEKTKKEFNKLFRIDTDYSVHVREGAWIPINAKAEEPIMDFISAYFIDRRTLEEELGKMEKKNAHKGASLPMSKDSYCKYHGYNQALQNIKEKLNL